MKRNKTDNHYNNGKNNSQWKGGLPHCINCKKIISRREYFRCKSCSNKFRKQKRTKFLGKNNPMWQGGLSLEGYYLFTYILKEKIRNRDSRKCQLCHIEEKKLKRKLEVHHIDYNKENYKENNLISLCKYCHIPTNANRDYWFAYFMEIIESIYEKTISK